MRDIKPRQGLNSVLAMNVMPSVCSGLLCIGGQEHGWRTPFLRHYLLISLRASGADVGLWRRSQVDVRFDCVWASELIRSR